MKTFYELIGVLIALVVIIFAVSKADSPASVSFGNVGIGNEYHSTTTIGKSGVTAYQVPECLSTLGTVNITGATALSALTIKDATSTTDANAITIATFASTALGGQYTFDTVLTRGLQLTIASGNGASTTITCR